MGLGVVGVRDKEFQNVIDQTHISGIQKRTGKDSGRKKGGVNFADFKKVILDILNLILYETLSSFLSRHNIILYMF